MTSYGAIWVAVLGAIPVTVVREPLRRRFFMRMAI